MDTNEQWQAILLQILRKARGKIHLKQHWLQDRFSNGSPWVKADRWCAVGAVRRAVLDLDLDLLRHHYEHVAVTLLDIETHRVFPHSSIVEINDDEGDADLAHRRVMQIFNRVIKRLQPDAPSLAPTRLEVMEIAKAKAESVV